MSRVRFFMSEVEVVAKLEKICRTLRGNGVRGWERVNSNSVSVGSFGFNYRVSREFDDGDHPIYSAGY